MKFNADAAERKTAVPVSSLSSEPKTVRVIPKWVWMVLLACGSAGALVILYFFAPTQYAFYPRCLFHSLTGLSCPGCGSLRAIHNLLHGHWTAAFHYNPLLIALLPVLAGVLTSYLCRLITGREPFPVFKRPFWIWVLLGLLVAFTIVRNLPFGPLTGFRL
jgi:Protein of unknown function (DUF2752)